MGTKNPIDSELTDYHAKYYAHELTRRCPSDSVEKFTAALMNSQVDLKPHQVDAALFAFRSPLAKGAILADEVGLGKTIEAGIVLSQKWAERKRKILIIVPSSLRKQWNQELADKFYLPSKVIDSKIFKQAEKAGSRNPFDTDEVVICSYYFARNKSDYVAAVKWDLVVIDEAHRLRNVYKTSNKIAKELKKCLEHAPKLLLTATPLQNSLLELYGLVSFIDEYTFGDLKSFRQQFARINSESAYSDLRERIAPVCKRTLRRQVLEYISFTERKAHTQRFEPTSDEEVLYDLVSEYLRRDALQALPRGQRNLMVLVMRKLLASSTFAIAGALLALANRLKARLKADMKFIPPVDPELAYEFEQLPEVADEWGIDLDEMQQQLDDEDRALIINEIAELESFYELAVGITENAKGTALLQGLSAGLEMTAANGGVPKALIFTESRRTQNYLAALLSENGYAGKIVLFNGSNNDETSREIYKEWKSRHAGSDRMSGVHSADIRAAIIDHFRDTAQIMIATEAAAEGINLQFCSLVVNYDLPWNPQRIEQRIGRCHRYGQKYDVVVVNFLNMKNAADQRVYELLDEKFRLFSGVFGASDEVLGSIESGVDFEKRIVEIYQTCRHPDEIKASFDALQAEMGTTIEGTMRDTRQKLLENFDTEVAEKLNVYDRESRAYLTKYEALLWNLTRHELDGLAEFDASGPSFILRDANAFKQVPTGKYTLQADEFAHHYRLQHPLALSILDAARSRELDCVTIRFDYGASPKNISILEGLVGEHGFLLVQRLSVESADSEDHILFAAKTIDGAVLDQDQCRRLFDLPGKVVGGASFDVKPLEKILKKERKTVLAEITDRNAVFFDEEIEKLDKWADDRRKSLKATLKDLDDTIKELKKQARTARNLPEKIAGQKKLRKLNEKRDAAWREYDTAARDIENKKDGLIDEVEARLAQKVVEEQLFAVQWSLV